MGSYTYKVGDDIYVTDDARVDITPGKVYVVTEVTITCVGIIDDAGDTHSIRFADISLVTTQTVPYQGAMGAGQRALRHTPPDDEEEDTYETRKANASVTTSGKFNKGDSLVYCDGTITQTTLTVRTCTNTCVWFEETYSMPFNPTEFQLEGSEY